MRFGSGVGRYPKKQKETVKMKKLLALLLALCMALCAVSALAEEGGDEIPAVENTPSYEGAEIAVADTGVLFTIPSDWNAVDAPEGYLATYVSADNTLSLSLLLVNQGIDACYEEMLAMVEAGTAKDITEVLVNEVYYVLYTSADELFSYAYLPLNDDYCIVLCFGAASADLQSDVPLEILGTAAVAE